MAICCCGVVIIRANMAPPMLAGGKMPVVRVQWGVPAKSIDYMAFSPSGQYICLVGRDGLISCYNSAGVKCFSAKTPGADRVVISPDGSCTVAYSHLNPTNSELTFLDSNGNVHWKMDVSGAVWSADSGYCDDGACFAVGTGEKHVYLITINGNRKRYRRWRTPGVVSSVALDASGKSIYYGTWQGSSLTRITTDGRRVWESYADPANLQYIQALDNPNRLFLRSIPNRSTATGEFELMNAKGRSLWDAVLDSSLCSRAFPSPDGQFVCVGYYKIITHKGKSTREKHTALYDESGNELWDKGSLLFPAVPVLVTHRGYVLVNSGGNMLFAISPIGNLKQACELPAAIISALSSRDGTRAMVRCADGKAYMLRISQ